MKKIRYKGYEITQIGKEDFRITSLPENRTNEIIWLGKKYKTLAKIKEKIDRLLSKSRQRDWQDKKVKGGKCQNCGKIRGNEHPKFCPECEEKKRLYRKKYALKNKSRILENKRKRYKKEKEMPKIILLILFLSAFFSSSAHAQISQGGTDFSLFPKWERVLKKIKGDLPMQRTSPLTLQEVEKVNDEVKKVKYTPEKEDVWKTPNEFYRDGGDCEDAAIAKYMKLYKRGVNPQDMYIVILDNPLYPSAESDSLHAVLQVKIDGKKYVLDIPHPSVNEKGGMFKAEDYYTTKIYYGINHKDWTRKP